MKSCLVWKRMAACCAGGTLLLSGCDRPATAPPAKPIGPGGTTMQAMTITTTAFAAGGPIPARFTGDGQDVSPPLSWSNVPTGALELVLIMDDPDAPTSEPWVHWMVYGISPTHAGLEKGVTASRQSDQAGDLREGLNSWRRMGYGGPAPPAGHGLHHYHFKLYALDKALDLDSGETKEAVVRAMAGHILAEAELVGTYQR